MQEDLRSEDHAAAKDRIYFFILQETNFLCDRNYIICAKDNSGLRPVQDERALALARILSSGRVQ